MCTVLEEDFMLEEKQADISSESRVCKKCQTNDATVILRKIDAYCKDCFFAASTHKFRAMLGKYRIIKPNEKVLVVYRLGQPSSALIHMIRCGLELTQHKRLRFLPEYLFIDEYDDLAKEEKINLLEKIKNQIQSFNFIPHFTSLSSFIKSNEPKLYSFDEYVNILNDNDVKNYKTLTNEQSINEIFKRNLTIEIAKILECSTVLTPDISIDTTVGILTSIALGRGSHISVNVGIIDDRDPKVKIFTPLRLFEMEELEYYNEFNNLNTICIENKYSPYESVQNLMKKFVEDLQINYPSTIKTVTRTGDKLTCKKTDNNCKMCKAPIEELEELSSIEATEFSKIVSQQRIDNLDNFDLIKKTHEFCFACNKLQKLSL